MKVGFRNIAFIGLLAFLPFSALAKGQLENPPDGSVQSGIGIFSGWYCDAEKIELVIDGRPAKEAAYGTKRNDTIKQCGDADNGFGLLWSYNLFGEGEHTVVAYADGVEFDRATFTVEYVQQDKLTQGDVQESAELLLPDYDKEVRIEWRESTQNFTITEVLDTEVPFKIILGMVEGDWTGQWQSVDGKLSGDVGFVFKAAEKGGKLKLLPTIVTLTDSGCQETTLKADPVDVNALSTAAYMKDGSVVDFEMRITESLNAIAGVFVFSEGKCEGLEGLFLLFQKPSPGPH